MDKISKLSALIFVVGLTASFNANAWFFFFIPGSATRAIGDAITGAKGDICVKDSYKVGDVITSAATGNTAKILSLSGTSSICQNAATPIRADVEFTYTFSSKAGIELSEDYEPQPIKDLERFNGRLLTAKSKSTSGKEIIIFSNIKKPNLDIEQMANNMERSQIALLKDGLAKGAEKIKIHGMNAVRFEVVGTKKGVFGRDATFLITLIDGGNEILVFNQYSYTSNYPESKAEFIAITESIKGLEGEVPSLIGNTSVQTAPGSGQGNSIDKLETLNGLLKKGLITKQDYELKKSQILQSM